MREVIATTNGPQAIGPYSQAIKANGFIFLSGQTALDPATQQLVSGGIAEQTERVLKNLEAILQAAGSSLDKVVHCSVFLKDMNDFAAMNAVYGQFFKTNPPARTTVGASRLPKDGLVEINVTALA
jgi:2-iminobutanoate/2-iminopropanoate deaminase